jgi:hypothetical protein
MSRSAALAELGEGLAIGGGAALADIGGEAVADTGAGIPIGIGIVAATAPWWGEAGDKISAGWNGLVHPHANPATITGSASPAIGVNAARKPETAQPAAVPQYAPQPNNPAAGEPTGSRSEAFRKAKRDLGIPMNQQPDGIRNEDMTDRNGKQIMDENGKPIRTRVYDYTRPGKSPENIVIQEHSAGHQFGDEDGRGDQGPHFNVRPKNIGDNIQNERSKSVKGTKEHYPFEK